MAVEEQPAWESDASEYAGAALECDIVMKGGITSGVVYPRAVTTLAKRYRFRNVGGTSAGAIAAVVTAAAEHNRDGGGFDRVAALPDELGSSPGGKPFTLQLFTPDEKTRPLFEVAVGFMRWSKPRAILNVFRWLPLATVPPLLLVVAAILLCVLAGLSAVWILVAVLAAILLTILGLALEAARAIRTLGENDFGICHLGGKGALTPWLHGKIQEAAGREVNDAPLTFADLWGVPPLPEHATDEERAARTALLVTFSHRPRMRSVDLQMMTTSLSHGRPMRLPAQYEKHRPVLQEGGDLLFRPSDMERFFPQRVVEHLKEAGGDPGAEARRRGLYRFPAGPDLPVIVATRMSLSFPILIAALTLWELDDAAPNGERRIVFSDGGITSNFPIHFFDSPAPTRPTFGLQLTGFEAGDGPKEGHPEHSVDDPPAPGDENVREVRSDLHDLRGFLTAIKDAMQNWRDNTQSQLAGSRERIARIKLDRGEGGLNLTMDKPKIDRLTGYGQYAGERLSTLFSGPLGAAPIETEHSKGHRFARYRVTMSVLERFLQDFASRYDAAGPHITAYPQLIDQHLSAEPYEFETEERRDAALNRSEDYKDLAQVTDADSLDDANVPRPPATLRSVPPV